MNYRFLHGLALLGFLTFVGCGGSGEEALPGTPVDNHIHEGGHEHNHAETFDEAVHELAEMRDTIRDGIKADDEGAYHEPLHEVGHVLEILEGFVKELPQDDQASATAAIEKLFDLFGQVDAKFHGSEGVDYADVSAEIDKNIDTLDAIAHGEHDKDAPETESKPADAESAEPEPTQPAEPESPAETPADKE